MMRFKSLGMTVPVVLAVAIILAAGGGAIASNMGFKMNKAIASGVQTGTTSTLKENWTALPYNNPYGTVGGFCNQTGLRTNLGSGAVVVITSATNNTPSQAICGTATANTLALPSDGRGIIIRQPNTAPRPDSIIIVGSHNPTLAVSFPP